MLFRLFLLINFFILYSYSIVSQILSPVSIFEESPLLSVVADLRPIFQTLDVYPYQAALLHSQPSQPFEYINGYIRLKSRLDREDYVRKRLCLGGNVLQCNFTLTLTVNLNQTPFNYILSQPISCHDINDMIPKFSQTEAKIFMAENVPIGHRIPLETAIDLDSPPYGIDNYRLETINGYEQYQFSIVYDSQSRELELIVKEKLDRESIEKYIFKLIAIDRGHPPNIGTQILTIEITDINDSPPKFESPIYNISVAENTIPEYLLKIHAIDNDIASNAELRYILENDYNGLFRLDKITGILTLDQALDYELHKSYQLKVEVYDNGINSLSDTCTIYVYVLDQNDHAPSIQMKFNPIFEHNNDGNMAYVKESFDINLPIAFVTVDDQDSGDYGKSQLTVEPHRLFYLETIRLNYYAVKSFRQFDRETISFYEVELRARDFGQPSLRRSMTFELNITDINDQKPEFKTNYTFDLIENNRIPTIIGQVNAFDYDQGVNGQITYTIIPSSSYFSITSNDGIISTNTSFDYEYKREYKFQVRANDHGQPSLESFVNIQINIININEYSPVFEHDHYEFLINENETIKFIGQVKAYDKDYGDIINYSLGNHEDLFIIDQNGKIWTQYIFDRELQDEYKLTVIATDNSTIGSTTVTIKIQDINDNPPIFIWPNSNEIRHILSDDHSQRIDINNPSSQFITDIIIRDNDIGNNSLIQLLSSNNEHFYIGFNNSLWLKNSSILPGTYTIELLAKNFQYETKKYLHIIIYQNNPLGLYLFNNMGKTLRKFPILFIFIFIFITLCLLCFLIIYYLCIKKNVQKKLYGSRLIVNDDYKSKQNSPQTKTTTATVILPSIHSNNYTVIAKQRKNSQAPSGNSPSTTDGEFSSSLLSCPYNNGSSSTSDLDRSHQHHHHHHQQHQPSSSTVSALTTLTRKSPRRQSLKNISLQSQTNDTCSNSIQNTTSTFSTLPKHHKRDIVITSRATPVLLTDCSRNESNGFPTLQTMLNQSTKDMQSKLPQPPPLLNGIILLDKMLTKSSISNDDKNHIVTSNSSSSNFEWYNNTSDYQTRASIV
ncbi:unnamed protein product [Adineta steineri]|uniref:Cadherin domain-containing protein n=3 Tax=Adineta steineri TaxID=433720 RepID=A0A815E4Y1_9BILA|nr:unnamed protein product [Adineta steineri]CAF3940550.1 unnamed protein product [Adineta steineri]